VVDETGGLIPAAILERMGAEGQILILTELDGPPAFGVLNTMNFGEREMACMKWLNWMEAEVDYKKRESSLSFIVVADTVADPPPEDDLPQASQAKAQARQKRHEQVVSELNATRWELHRGNWDG
jgi:tRNA (adenine-N(1)-)-methyltransferase non-catalytic subunit